MNKACSVARSLEVIGDRWTFLVLRELFHGPRRFEDLFQCLGIARNILAGRLKHLLSHGILMRRKYQERPPRYEYILSRKGRDLYPVFLALLRWGDRWLTGNEKVALALVHTTCGHPTHPAVTCSHCGQELQARDVRYEAGPGVAGEAWPRRINSRRRSRKAGENSSLLVRALDLIGDRWTFLVLREAFFGVRRFEDFHQNLGIARNILTSRLSLLVRNGIFEKRMYQKRPDRFEYRFTEKGLDLYAVPLTLMRWGDRWLAGKAGPPLVLFHKSCGYRTLPRITCSHCGLELKAATARGTDFGAIPPRT